MVETSSQEADLTQQLIERQTRLLEKFSTITDEISQALKSTREGGDILKKANRLIGKIIRESNEDHKKRLLEELQALSDELDQQLGSQPLPEAVPTAPPKAVTASEPEVGAEAQIPPMERLEELLNPNFLDVLQWLEISDDLEPNEKVDQLYKKFRILKKNYEHLEEVEKAFCDTIEEVLFGWENMTYEERSEEIEDFINEGNKNKLSEICQLLNLPEGSSTGRIAEVLHDRINTPIDSRDNQQELYLQKLETICKFAGIDPDSDVSAFETSLKNRFFIAETPEAPEPAPAVPPEPEPSPPEEAPVAPPEAAPTAEPAALAEASLSVIFDNLREMSVDEIKDVLNSVRREDLTNEEQEELDRLKVLVFKEDGSIRSNEEKNIIVERMEREKRSAPETARPEEGEGRRTLTERIRDYWVGLGEYGKRGLKGGLWVGRKGAEYGGKGLKGGLWVGGKGVKYGGKGLGYSLLGVGYAGWEILKTGLKIISRVGKKIFEVTGTGGFWKEFKEMRDYFTEKKKKE